MGCEVYALEVLQVMMRVPLGTNGFSFAHRGD